MATHCRVPERVDINGVLLLSIGLVGAPYGVCQCQAKMHCRNMAEFPGLELRVIGEDPHSSHVSLATGASRDLLSCKGTAPGSFKFF